MDAHESISRGRITKLAVIASVLVALAVVAPEIYTGTFSDLGTFLRVAAVAVGLVLIAVVARRYIPNRSAATAVAVVPAVVALAVFVWPYLRPATEIDEAFPPVAPPAENVATTAPSTAPVTTPVTAPVTTSPTPATAAQPATTAAPVETAPPADPSSATQATAATAPAATTPPSTVPPAPPTTVAPTTPPTSPPPTTASAPTEPVQLARSGFQGLTGHRGSGDAALYRLADQSILLRFEEVDIGSGPDLDVYVVSGEDRRGLDGAIYVAPLTAERGNQNYTPPADVDLTTGTWTVLVWCETFDVEVANATIRN